MEFQAFKKIPRLSREITITEKLDGSNAQIFIYNSNEELRFPFINYEDFPSQKFIKEFLIAEKDGVYMFAGSRKRWLKVGKNSDNMGFASWVKENAEDLFNLGEGRHYGEWYGKGVQVGYGLDHKRLALFNVGKWHDKKTEQRLISINQETGEEKYTQLCPNCCEVVPIFFQGDFCTQTIDGVLGILKTVGSKAVPGFMNPEGIIIYHTASGQLFKKTILNDEKPKGV
jgi:hypothetical protein